MAKGRIRNLMPGQWFEWILELKADGAYEEALNNTITGQSVWHQCGLAEGVLVDLYLLETRWRVNLGFGRDWPQQDMASKPNILWTHPPAINSGLERKLLIEDIAVGTPLWVGPKAKAIRRAVGEGSPSPGFNDPIPVHGQDFAGDFEFGCLQQDVGLRVTPIMIANADLNSATVITWEVWVQAQSGLWTLAIAGNAAPSALVNPFFLTPARHMRRVYVRLGGGDAGTVAFVDYGPNTLPGHDFTPDGGQRISEPYVRVRFGAVIKEEVDAEELKRRLEGEGC